MKRITCYLDFVSPFAYLAFERLPLALQGLSWQVDYKPILFGAILKHYEHLGPAEIPPKRDWTYRHVLWLGHHLGVPLQMPAVHPFNPLGPLRLAMACGQDGLVNRHVAETVFRHVWQGGADAADPARLAELAGMLQPARDPAGEAVKSELRANTDEAIACGVFGVPAFVVDGKQFWGLDSLPMLREYLEGNPWFDGGDWEAVQALPAMHRR